MSANWAQIATVLCLNLCAFFSQFHFLMGDAAQTMGYFDYMALALASLALWTYNLEKEKIPFNEQNEEENIMAAAVLDSPLRDDELNISIAGSSQSGRTSQYSGTNRRRNKGSVSATLSASMVADGPFGKAMMTSSFSQPSSSMDFRGGGSRNATPMQNFAGGSGLYNSMRVGSSGMNSMQESLKPVNSDRKGQL